jgi:competence protein ComEA
MDDSSEENWEKDCDQNTWSKIDFEALAYKYRYLILFCLVGIILIGLGALNYKKNIADNKTIEIIKEEENANKEIIVEVAGQVVRPGVYKLPNGSRIDDAIIIAGGINEKADRVWMDKYVNRAAKLTDGQKIYIIKSGELSTSSVNQSEITSANFLGDNQSGSSVLGVGGSGLVNINTASIKELDTLYGIGPVYAQKIIEQRPYSNIEELVSKGVLKSATYEKIKDKLTVY